MKFNLTFLSLLSSLVVVYALPAVDNAALPPQVEVKPLSDVKNIARDYDQSGNYDNDHSGDYDNDHDHSGGYDNGYDNGDNNGYGNGYKDYDRCSQEREDTLCSPSNADRLGRTFDLLYKGKDGRRAATDYVTLSFVNTRSNRRVNINSKYGQKVRGDKSLIEANNIYIPCGTRGEYYLSVMSNYVNYENDYRDNQETWWGPYDIDTKC